MPRSRAARRTQGLLEPVSWIGQHGNELRSGIDRPLRHYVESTQGKLSLHFLPGHAPELNPDELLWSDVKRTGAARRPLQQGEKLVRSFFHAPSVAYIRDC